MTARIDVAVVGCGHMGALHARTVAAHPGCRLVAAVDVDLPRARALAELHGAEARSDVPEGVAAVVVATPTETHLDLASAELDAGRWVLVEKPLALCRPQLAVGHVERFNPALRAAGALQPRYVEARRLAPPTHRGADVCVVMDLMVHDLDLLLSWATGDVEVVDAAGFAVRGEDVDVATVRLRTSCGIRAHLHASRVAEIAERVVRVYEEARTTRLDLLKRRAQRDEGRLPDPDGGDGLTAQWDAFVRAVKGEAPIAVGGWDGSRVVTLAERIRDEIAARATAGRSQRRRGA